MGLLVSPWDDSPFTLKEGIAYGTIACANWLIASLHQIESTVYVPTDLAIYNSLSSDLDTNLMGPFTSIDANVEPLRICKTV